MTYHTDGFTIRANPSPIGGGFTVTDGAGKLIKTKEIQKAGFTNNEGELRGIYYALTIASEGDTIVTDSLLCIGWIQVGFSRKRADLNKAIAAAKQLVEEKRIDLMFKPRWENHAGKYNEAFH